MLVDVLGLALAVAVTVASVQDRDGLVLLMSGGEPRRWPTLEALLVDGAYVGSAIDAFAKQSGIRVEVTRPPPGMKGFTPVRKRWVAERTFGWINRERLLSQSYERLRSTEEADIHTA